MRLVMGFELSRGDEALHHPSKLDIHHRPFGVVFFAGWIITGIAFLKLCVVWVNLYNLHKSCNACLFAVAVIEAPFSSFMALRKFGAF